MARDNVTTGRVAENSDDTVSTHELNKKRDRATCIRQSPKQTSAPLNRSIAHDETMNDETNIKTCHFFYLVHKLLIYRVFIH